MTVSHVLISSIANISLFDFFIGYSFDDIRPSLSPVLEILTIVESLIESTLVESSSNSTSVIFDMHSHRIRRHFRNEEDVMYDDGDNHHRRHITESNESGFNTDETDIVIPDRERLPESITRYPLPDDVLSIFSQHSLSLLDAVFVSHVTAVLDGLFCSHDASAPREVDSQAEDSSSRSLQDSFDEVRSARRENPAKSPPSLSTSGRALTVDSTVFWVDNSDSSCISYT
jgi:hypothetical protein